MLRVGIAHAQFETIHPFLDGNGRVGRLLITFLLCEKDILKRPLLYLSHYLKRFRQEYYERLQAVRDQGDWENWLKFFLRGVADVSDEATIVARKIVELRESNRRLLTEKMGKGAGTAIAIMERLFDHPIVTVRAIAEDHDLSVPRANTVVNELTKLGVLKEITGRQRDRIFSYEGYLSLFQDEPVADAAPEMKAGPEETTVADTTPPAA